MQYNKLTDEQKKIHAWRLKRNSLICKFMDDGLSNEEAIRKANRELKNSKKETQSANPVAPSSAIKLLQENAGVCYFQLDIDTLKHIEKIVGNIVCAFKKDHKSSEHKLLQLVRQAIRHDSGDQHKESIKSSFLKLYKKYGWMNI